MARGKARRSSSPTAEHEANEEEMSGVSEYELARLARIKRNEAFMTALNLGSLKAASSPVAKKRSLAKRPRDPSSRAVPSRTSRRLRGCPADPDDLVAIPGTWSSSLAAATTKPGCVPSSIRHDWGPELNAEEAEERMKVLKSHIDAREEEKVRAIERARGAQAKEKMLVFSRVLRAKGKTELAEMAEAALDRLVRGVPMPEKES